MDNGRATTPIVRALSHPMEKWRSALWSNSTFIHVQFSTKSSVECWMWRRDAAVANLCGGTLHSHYTGRRQCQVGVLCSAIQGGVARAASSLQGGQASVRPATKVSHPPPSFRPHQREIEKLSH